MRIEDEDPWNPSPAAGVGGAVTPVEVGPMHVVRRLGVPFSSSPALLVVALTAAVALGACSGASSSPPPPATADRADSGSTITLAPGQTLLVNLDTNPSTGFAWLVEQEPDPKVLETVGEQVDVPQSGGQVGAGGTVTLTFVARDAGETAFALVYKQPWEAAGADRFELTVVVR